ncbi:CoA ester lyase [soil metagenome]
MLFVPGNMPDKFTKARASVASALILDLEDSVAPAAKVEARRQVVQMLQSPASPQQLWLRVNAAPLEHLLADLAAAVPARPFGIVLPKCNGSASLAPVAHYLDALETAASIPLGSTRILGIATETSASLFNFAQYAGCTPRLWGLAWGAEDLSADVGALGNRDGDRYSDPYRLARSLCLFGATAAGVRAIDSVCTSLKDVDEVHRESAAAFRDGFAGKMAVHPAQLQPIEDAFKASSAQLDWSRRVLAAFEANPGAGALQLDGRMIDEPHAKLARRLLGQEQP